MHASVAAQFADTADEGRKWLQEAFEKFAGEVVEHGQGLDMHWHYLAYMLGNLAIMADEDYFADGATFIEMEDRVTGEIIEDPDEELADQPWEQGVLAAMRMLAALGNKDLAAFDALFETSGEMGTGAIAMYVMAQCAGRAWIDKLKEEGKIPEELASSLAAREAEEIVESASVEEPTVRTSQTGVQFRSMPVDERDTGPNFDPGIAAPHGDAVYALTMYPAGIDQARENAIRGAHEELIGGALNHEGPLCGVHHWEVTQVHEVPYSARRPLQRQLRKLKRHHGREFVVIRCWQHKGGTCPE